MSRNTAYAVDGFEPADATVGRSSDSSTRGMVVQMPEPPRLGKMRIKIGDILKSPGSIPEHWQPTPRDEIAEETTLSVTLNFFVWRMLGRLASSRGELVRKFLTPDRCARMRDLRLPEDQDVWTHYLTDQIEPVGQLSQDHISRVSALWTLVRSVGGEKLPLPVALPTDDGALHMAWTVGRQHLSVDAYENSWDWFYRDRERDESDGGDSEYTEPVPAGFVRRLEMLVGSR